MIYEPCVLPSRQKKSHHKRDLSLCDWRMTTKQEGSCRDCVNLIHVSSHKAKQQELIHQFIGSCKDVDQEGSRNPVVMDWQRMYTEIFLTNVHNSSIFLLK